MTIRAILFDKDGTLVDFHATYDAATSQVLESICKGDSGKLHAAAEVLDFDLENGRIRETSVIVAGSGLEITQRLQPVLKIEDVEAYSRYLDRLYGDICTETVEWLPGVPEALTTLTNSGFRLGIATNDSEANAITQFSTLKATQHFEVILGADSGYGGKPGPGMVTAFSALQSIPAGNILMVGDSTHDLEAGKSAGAKCCGVLTGPADRADLEKAAEYVIDSVVDLPELLSNSL